MNPNVDNFCGYEGNLKTSLTSGNGFHGIGSLATSEIENKFYGIFDGNNCTISNLFINDVYTSSSAIGLFTYNYGTIQNIGLENIKINIEFNPIASATCFIGGLVGRNEGTISSIYTSGNIYSIFTGTGNKSIRTGGICGQITSGLIENSYNVANITTEGNQGTSTNIGGCVGGLSTDALLLNSYNMGIVKENNNKTINAGGIVGSNSQTSSIITNCYYLYGTYDIGIGNKIGVSDVEENLVKSSDYMKSNEFLNLIGISHFKITADKNNGYPILYWQ